MEYDKTGYQIINSVIVYYIIMMFNKIASDDSYFCWFNEYIERVLFFNIVFSGFKKKS